MIDCIIIGGGPAGLMAANILQQDQINYLLFDKNKTLGRKLLITGGTRCNVTNKYQPKKFIEKLKIKNRRFLYSTLTSFGTLEARKFFEEKGVDLILEKNYQYFPKSSKSSDILTALTKNINQKKVILNTVIKDITKEEDYYVLKTSLKSYKAKNIVIATGSKSYPKTGSTGDGVTWAKKFNHTVIPFYPAETNLYSDFVKNNKEYLQGISIANCDVKINNLKSNHKGDLIFTHFGLGGPVIQDISELVYFELQKGNTSLFIKLTKFNEDEILELFSNQENQKTRVIRIIEKLTIKRLAKYIIMQLNIDETKQIANLSKNEKMLIIEKLLRFDISIDKVESIDNAFVNGGGVSTDEINPSTMESKLNKGLYFTGEVLNLHGPIGGFNITIALSTGYTAAKSIGGN